MVWKLLFLFFAVAAAFDDEDYPDSFNPDCMEQMFKECDMEIIMPDYDFPRNKEELQESCKIINEYAACAINVLENCKPTDEMAAPFYNAKNIFNHICDEDSQLFQVIVDNLQCVSDNIIYFHQPCPLSPKETQDLNDLVNLFSAADEDAFQNAEMCMRALTGIGCGISKLGKKCGERAKDALVEILQMAEKPFERCGPGVKENLPLIAGILDTEEELAEELQEMKKKRKK